MTRDEFNSFCASLPTTTHVVQWGNSDVWKVGGKVFAITSVRGGADTYTFKASEMAFEILSDAPGIMPAPYLASRGLKWLCCFGEPGLSDDSLRDHVCASYDMVVAKLTRKKRAELGL
ncbi:hypothetical protein C1J03_04505 [Sulfitobacter sp. SK012]|uniref:MmcQ/YjbR family DNA-binding protein n=1 Tax=Sulfitobacter sp. SK012 TaxID=1389005 RepID=UPI000E09F8EC|nr:MmcQ/YjbR family DNA-binding protein [Sulfitobacter sp. SK012]AXI45363.1 hypothetical protein C1J03_04505 [Sulfitobacter sp. SK012]